MKKLLYLIISSVLVLSSCNNSSNTSDDAINKLLEKNNDKTEIGAPISETPVNSVPKTDSILAYINTSRGLIICDLFYDMTPLTVANFMGLSEGTIPNNFRKGKPFYDGIKFHRVIKDFMIQGGDPNSTNKDPNDDGMGGPGYQFKDEVNNGLTFDRPGLLAMANSGPGTNGSQFFITHVPTPHLDNMHTIFGQVISGQEVVNAIQQGDVIKSIKIKRNGEKAKNFNAAQICSSEIAVANASSTPVPPMPTGNNSDLAEFDKWVAKNYPKAKKVEDMYILVTKKGSGDKPKAGQKVTAHYTGTLDNGKKFDSSVDRGQPFEFNILQNQVIRGWDVGFSNLNKGSKATLIIPYTYGYGEGGMPPTIPAKATLIFDVELIDFK